MENLNVLNTSMKMREETIGMKEKNSLGLKVSFNN